MYEERVFCGTGELCILSKEILKFFVQVKAVGKTYHKTCLRCMECGTSLHSNKLLDHDGDPFCVRCHSKVLLSTFTLEDQGIIIYYCLKSFMDPKGMDMHCLGRRAAKFFFLVSSYLLFLINIDDWCDMPACGHDILLLVLNLIYTTDVTTFMILKIVDISEL
jgi:DNA-directed RNA polymerase subunit RPC12/RpoP